MLELYNKQDQTENRKQKKEKSIKEKAKAIKEKEKAKATKEKEKAKAIKEKEKAKAIKEKVKKKAKAIKEKEKAKAIKEKAHKKMKNEKISIKYRGGSEENTGCNQWNADGLILRNTSYIEQIFTELIKSEKTNKFEFFWDSITEFYKKIKDQVSKDKFYSAQKIYYSTGIICEQIYEHMRMFVAFGDNPNDHSVLLGLRIYPCSFFIRKNIIIKICNNIPFNINLICEYLKDYIKNIIDFKINNDELLKKYIIQNITIYCTSDVSHRLILVITPTDTEDTNDVEIAIIDPGSFSTNYTGDVLFDTTYKIFKCLDKKDITAHNGRKYKIVCPQLDSVMDVQLMLSVGNNREGACAIIAYLIVNTMIYMKIKAREAIQLISTIIVRKFMLQESIVSFADGYLLYLFNIHKSPHLRPTCKMDDDEEANKKLEERFFELISKKVVKETGSSFFVDFGVVKNAIKSYISSPYSIRVPFEKIESYSGEQVVLEDTPAIKTPWYLEHNIRWLFKGVDVVNITPIYVPEEGLVPFKTVYPITPFTTEVRINYTDGYKTIDRVDSIYNFTPVIYTNKNDIIQLVQKELTAIKTDNQFIQNFINLKIGEMIYLKVKPVFRWVYFSKFLKQIYPDFNYSYETLGNSAFISKIGESYIDSLIKYYTPHLPHTTQKNHRSA